MMVLVLLIAPIWIYPIFIMKVMCFALFACAAFAIGVLARVVYRHAQAALIEERFVIERRLQNQADDGQ